MVNGILQGKTVDSPGESYGALLYRSLQNGGDNIAMINAETGEETTYQEIFECTVSLAKHLQRLRLTKNDTISICSPNSVYFTIPTIAALYLGITFAPVNHFYTPAELVHCFNLSKPTIVFCTVSSLENIITACKSIKTVKKIILLDKNTTVHCDIPSLEELLHFNRHATFEVTPVDDKHVVAILCSSGTTGLAKGVMLTHKNFQAAHIWAIDPDFPAFRASKIGLALLPFYHAYGLTIHLIMLAMHMKMVVLARFEEQLFLSAIQQHRVTNACLVPPLILFLGKSPIVTKYDLSSIREIVCGAAPLGREIQELTMKRLGSLNIRQGYGLTESTLGVTLTPANRHKHGSVGVVGPNMQLKVRDPESNRTLGPNEEGEICMRGALIMQGYIGNPEATASTLDSEGWLLTGDVGYYDTDGYVYIVDRYKELIKYKGLQVPPAEIEAILLKHPQIKDCGVIGRPDTAAGEVPVAFVVKQARATITETDVINFAAAHLSHHKRLHGGVRFVQEIPKSATGKILRRVLREQLNVASKL
ncbi:uncharacterized protein CBL_20029 [Carabus blaptoides fortunei]